MKLFRNVTIALGVAALIISFSTLSHANWGKSKDGQGHLKTMREAAVALQATHPDLAKDLNKYADQDEKKMDKMKKHCEGVVKDLRASSAALQVSNPDLATGLNALADQKTKMMQGEEMDWAKVDFGADIKLLRDSAAVLQASQGDLAGKMNKLADKKEAMKKLKDEGEPEM